MSSDQTQPVPEWWQQPQAPKRDQESQRDQGHRDNQDAQGTQDLPGKQSYQDSQATQQYPAGQGYSSGPAFPSGQGHQSDQGQGYPSGPGFPSGQGYQRDQDYPGQQGYQGTQGYPGDPGGPGGGPGFPAAAQGYQAPPTRRRRRRWPWITLIVIIVVLVGGDRAAKAYAEDQMASQVQSSLALSGKPHVTVQGFPFLTQLAARTFNTVDVNATNETAGPGGQLKLASLTATLHGLHIRSTKTATVDDFNASALVTFTALAEAGGIPQGITLSSDGPNTIKVSIDILGFGTSATAKVTQVGNNKINIKMTEFAGVPGDVLGNAADFTITIPKLPAGVTITSISVTQQGLRLTATGHNTTLSK
jgi:LmeA-like phospholipid-binding